MISTYYSITLIDNHKWFIFYQTRRYIYLQRSLDHCVYFFFLLFIFGNLNWNKLNKPNWFLDIFLPRYGLISFSENDPRSVQFIIYNSIHISFSRIKTRCEWSVWLALTLQQMLKLHPILYETTKYSLCVVVVQLFELLKFDWSNERQIRILIEFTIYVRKI